MSNNYKNIVFTKHALERMGKRSIDKNKIWQAVNHPDKAYRKDYKSKRYIREIDGRNYYAVATYLPKEKKHLVISAWVRGEDDKQSIVWILITLPFKIAWWILKIIFITLKKLFGKKR